MGYRRSGAILWAQRGGYYVAADAAIILVDARLTTTQIATSVARHLAYVRSVCPDIPITILANRMGLQHPPDEMLSLLARVFELPVKVMDVFTHGNHLEVLRSAVY